MDTDRIEYIIKTNVLARERLVGNLEKVLEDKIEYVDKSLRNTDFLQEIKNSIITSMQDFRIGEDITMIHSANDAYGCTKDGSKGRIISLKNDKEIKVEFYYQTGCSDSNKSDTYTVNKDKSCKTRFYDLFKKLKDYESVAENIMGQVIEDINIFDMCSSDIEKLMDKDKVYLINDKALLEEVKQDSIYSKRTCLDGARKYIRGVGVVGIVVSPTLTKNSYLLQGKNIEKVLQKKDYLDYDAAKLAQAESSQDLAELSIMEEAKKVNANYVLINQKHIIPSEDRTLTTVIEGLPYMIIGKQEVEDLLNKPSLEEDVVTAIKNLVPSEMIKSNYTSFAKLYPQEFIKFFSSIESTEQKKIIIESLMKKDYDDKEVIAWLDEHESGLVREVGLKII